MDRMKFIQAMKDVKSSSESRSDRDKINKIMIDSIDSNVKDEDPRGYRNLIIVIEELSELAKELTKQLRGKGDIANILQELADVQLGIYYVQEIVGIDDKSLFNAMTCKMNYLASKLYNEGQYQ